MRIFALIALTIAACHQPCASDADCKGAQICDAELLACLDPDETRAARRSVSSVDLCRAGCAADVRCGSRSTADGQACSARCDEMASTFAEQDAAQDGRCLYAPQARARRLACIMLDCAKITACVAALDSTCHP